MGIVAEDGLEVRKDVVTVGDGLRASCTDSSDPVVCASGVAATIEHSTQPGCEVYRRRVGAAGRKVDADEDEAAYDDDCAWASGRRYG